MIDVQITEILAFVSVGILGGLLHEILWYDGTIILPKKVKGELHLGTLTSAAAGIAIALIVDRSMITAFFAALGLPSFLRIFDKIGKRKQSHRKE